MPTTYRILIVDSPTRSFIGEWLKGGSYNRTTGDQRIYWTRSYDAAVEQRERFTAAFPDTTYSVIGKYGRDWDYWRDLYARRPPYRPAPVVEDDDEEDEPEFCDDCGEDIDDCGGDHTYYECDECSWGCGAPDCDCCLIWYDGERLCETCYDERTYESEGGGRDGLSVRTCGVCNSQNLHHDELREVYVCDHEARILVERREPVTLAHPLPAAVTAA